MPNSKDKNLAAHNLDTASLMVCLPTPEPLTPGSVTWKEGMKDLGRPSIWQYSKISVRWIASIVANFINS